MNPHQKITGYGEIAPGYAVDRRSQGLHDPAPERYATTLMVEPERQPQVQAAVGRLNLATENLRAALLALAQRIEPALNRIDQANPVAGPAGHDAPIAHAVDMAAVDIEGLVNMASTLYRRVEL